VRSGAGRRSDGHRDHQGTAADSTGSVLPGVLIQIKNQDTGAARELTTNEQGFYSATFLPWPLLGHGETDWIQHRRPRRRGRRPEPDQVADFQMKPASREETVTVVGASPPINTVNAEVKGALTSQQIADKPTLNPGSFLSLAEIFAGYQENPTSGQNNPTASSGSSINFNGTGTRGRPFRSMASTTMIPPRTSTGRRGAVDDQGIPDSDEYYSAEFGRGSAESFWCRRKSGTNQWRGDAYEFMQDSE
jgi:hypothetical protein